MEDEASKVLVFDPYSYRSEMDQFEQGLQSPRGGGNDKGMGSSIIPWTESWAAFCTYNMSTAPPACQEWFQDGMRVRDLIFSFMKWTGGSGN